MTPCLKALYSLVLVFFLSVAYTPLIAIDNPETIIEELEASEDLSPLAVCVAFVNVSVEPSSCEVVIAPEFIDGGSSDSNGDPITLTVTNPGPYSPGTYTVFLEVSSGAGGTATCFSTVTVEDKTSPTAICIANLAVAIGPGGSTTLFPGDLDAGSFDNCATNLSFASGPTFDVDCSDLGDAFDLFLIVDDGNGNSNTCFTTVQVQDPLNICNNQGPVAICAAAVNVSLPPASCDVLLLPEFIDAGSFDPDGDPINLSLDAPGPYGPGVYNVILTVSDGSLTNSCFSTVTVEDKTSPTAICIANLSVALGPGGTSILFPADIDAGSFDNCAVNLSFASGPTVEVDCNDVGDELQLILEVDDGSGNANSCFTTVQVQDPQNLCANTAPFAICASEVNVSLPANSCEVLLLPEFIDAGSFDPDGDPINLSLDAPGPYGPGIYNVILTVSDGSLSSSCFSTVTVEDKTNPTAVCIANLVVAIGPGGTTTLFPEDLDAGSFDNCATNFSFDSGPTVEVDCDDLGDTFELILVVDDGNGNSNSCFTTVLVQDPLGVCDNNQAPVAICASEVNVSLPAGSCEVLLLSEFIDAGSFDPDGDPINLSLDAPGPYGPGIYNVVLTVSDGSLSNSCFSTVTVEDKTIPTAICLNGLVASLGPDGTFTLFPEDVDAGSFDNCAVNLSFASGPTVELSCSDVGDILNVILIVDDGSGNSASCNTTLEVQDQLNVCNPNQAPVAICLNGLVAQTGPNCLVDIFPEDFDAGSFDPDGDLITFSLDNPGPFVPGTYVLTLMVSDGNLSSQCVTTLEVTGLDEDGDGVSICDGDCDDTNPDVFPGAPEVCDGLDNDCDNSIDEPDGVSTNYEWIERVQLADLDNTSGNDGGYGNYTFMSAALALENNSTITLTPGFSGAAYEERWRVYIDLNQDGIFQHPGERVVQTRGEGLQIANINLPAGTLTGTTRMRVIMSYDSFRRPCADNFDGEMEDYTVVIDECENSPGCLTYCESSAASTAYEWIRRVRLNGINNNSGDDGGYGDYTNLSAEVAPGTTYEMRLRPGFAGTSYQEYWRVWVDWNQDGAFDPVNELAVEENDNGRIITSLSVPTDALNGATRMRVSMQYNAYAESCESFSEGEVEDYTLIVTTDAALQIAPADLEVITDEEAVTDESPDIQGLALPAAEHRDNQLKLSVFPNPAQDFVNLRLEGSEDTPVTITLTDGNGRRVWKQRWDDPVVQLQLNLSQLQLPTGVYTLSVISGDTLEVQRLVITAGR